jgi:threonine dehydrogenase-like Zn-dependent dehydrogenase
MGRDRDGALCELVAAPPDNIYPVPEAVDDDTAPLIQVLTTCVHSQRRIGIFPGDSVAVVGLGVTGLLQVQLARTRGAWPVIGITRSASKRELAERLGADMTFDAEDGNVVNLVREATGGTGPDVVIESAGTTQTLARSIELVRTGGRVLSYGTITQQQGALPFYQLYYKELDIVGARAAQAEDYPVAIGAVGSGRIRLPELVTHRFELPEADQAMRMSGSGGSLKVVVRVGD